MSVTVTVNTVGVGVGVDGDMGEDVGGRLFVSVCCCFWEGGYQRPAHVEHTFLPQPLTRLRRPSPGGPLDHASNYPNRGGKHTYYEVPPWRLAAPAAPARGRLLCSHTAAPP